MTDRSQQLRAKQVELTRVKKEVEALRLVAKLLEEDFRAWPGASQVVATSQSKRKTP